MKTLTTTVARLLFAIPFGVFGIIHFISGSEMAGMVPFPGGVFWVYLVGIALLAAAVSVISGKQTHLALLLLALLLAVFVLTVHIPAIIGGDQMAMGSLLKDLSLAGGALILSNEFESQ